MCSGFFFGEKPLLFQLFILSHPSAENNPMWCRSEVRPEPLIPTGEPPMLWKIICVRVVRRSNRCGTTWTVRAFESQNGEMPILWNRSRSQSPTLPIHTTAAEAKALKCSPLPIYTNEAEVKALKCSTLPIHTVYSYMQPRRNYCISFFFAVITSWIAVAQSGVNCTGTECFTITAARKNDANVSISTTTRNLISRIQNNTQSAFTTKSIITDPTSVSLSASSTTTPGASNTTTSIVTNRCSTISILQAMDWCDPSIMPIFYIFFAWSAICTAICVTACACITWQSCSSKNLRKIKSFASITYFDNNVCVTLSPASTPRPLNRFSLPTSPRDFSNFVHSIVTDRPRPRPGIHSPCSDDFDGYTGPHPGIELTSYVDIVWWNKNSNRTDYEFEYLIISDNNRDLTKNRNRFLTNYILFWLN